ncbi:MAG: small ribosomal subunit Rsm22 family protein [Oligoflexia bacterium]|nr:small ribosomal subunit Rsm22 family protein [Oligoflexia bacterium]
MPIKPISTHGVKKIAQPPTTFPPAWLWFVDELIPSYVKKNYSPRESWRDKPFTKEDTLFFSKGVIELSELFTTDRPIGPGARMPSYFLHPKFRSAYLLYFLPLQMAKFVMLFERHAKAVDAALEHGRKNGKLRIADLGAGPGTASIALMLSLLRQKGEIPPIELIWLDTNRTILEDGKALAEALASQFPRLRGKLTVTLHEASWWTAPRAIGEAPCSLILMGHVLNEARQIPGARPSSAAPSLEGEEGDENESRARPLHPVWHELHALASGGGLLAVEPAYKGSSQNLSRIRDQLLQNEIEPDGSAIWGPCLHAEACPMTHGRDWCHFSVPVQVPGKWFRAFSEALGSERQWLKYSYLWLASNEFPGPKHDPRMRRVLSDPMSASKDRGEVLLCEPVRPGRIASPSHDPLWRGDLILVKI